jgi:hypothetical protein
MSRSMHYSELLNRKLSFKKPLFIVDLDLTETPTPTETHTPSPKETPTPTETHTPSPTETIGGQENRQQSSVETLNRNVDVRRRFIQALHLATDKSYEILRNMFLHGNISMDASILSYNYLDSSVDEYLDGKKCTMVEFPMVESVDISTDTRALYKQTNVKTKTTCLIYKTYSSVNQVVVLWYNLLGITITNLTDEVQSLKAAGFTVVHEIVPDNNPLGIKYLILEV